MVWLDDVSASISISGVKSTLSVSFYDKQGCLWDNGARSGMHVRKLSAGCSMSGPSEAAGFGREAICSGFQRKL